MQMKFLKGFDFCRNIFCRNFFAGVNAGADDFFCKRKCRCRMVKFLQGFDFCRNIFCRNFFAVVLHNFSQMSTKIIIFQQKFSS